MMLVVALACTAPTDPTPDDPVETDTTDTDTDTDVDPDTDPAVIEAPSGDPQTVELLGTCAPTELLGGFQIEGRPWFGFFDGVINIDPPMNAPTVLNTSANCTLYDGLVSSRVPGEDFGAIEAAGLRPGSIAIEPSQRNNAYTSTEVENPPVGPGELVEVRATDGPFGPFNLHGVGVEPLHLIAHEPLVVAPQALTVTWVPPADSHARSTIRFELELNAPASPVLECVWEDSPGLGVVPAHLMTELYTSGSSGSPTAALTRFTADKVEFSTGCIELEVSSPTREQVEVIMGEGPHCRDNTDCTPPETCNTATSRCDGP